ncbi:glycosyltransferase [Bradyrhizobium cenepequi]|uniref:glycosyltransferase n=1 Tax=Bradyrhizobium cenepequi TaxID=2821403 RepID=UPI001CE2DD9E|nr:glycosyltransferase [Bradyrhizobium cenepequi]MCA6105808.1 glycosyltransferase [Bradyrhizobium cenepequi]
MGDVVFLFPSYRPTASFPRLLNSLRQLDASTPIVVVDDGSDPVHANVFEAVKAVPGVTLLRNAVNLGKGAALKHGMNHILLEHPNSIGTVTADADGQHSAKDIVRLRDELRRQPDHVILGCRDFGKNIPFRSRFGNVVSRYVYRLLLGLHLSDTQTGLRGIPRKLMAASLHIRANRYEYETEQLIVAKQEGLATHEIPIQTIYIDDNRASHFNPLLDSFRIYFVLLRYALSSIATAIADFIAFYVLTNSNVPVLSANMGARGFALWIQFMLLKKYVFKSKAGLATFAAYVAYVFFSGYVSSLAQIQFTAHIVQSPLLAKTVVELAIWIFNFMFLRDIIFRRWSEV